VTSAALFNAPSVPYFSTITIPALPNLSLSEDEQRLVSRLQMRQWWYRSQMMLTDAYYRGEQVITDLGIAIPPQLSGLRTLVGWPRIAVDPLVLRLNVESFRLPGATDSDGDLTDLWDQMQGEQGLLYKDCLVKGRGWLMIGSPASPGDLPLICVESPLNVTALWDVRSQLPEALLQTYWFEGQRHAAFYTPDQTVHIGSDENGTWSVTDRDKHGSGFVPAVRVANEPESDRRDGRSEITAEIMSITDAACRTLLGLEVAREFYSVPQKYILGATESDFKNADGTAKSAWATYISHILALEADEEGSPPTVGQFKAYDPAVFTKIVEMYGSQMAGILGAPPQDLGLYTDGNPISAEALQVSESRRDRYARWKQKSFGPRLISGVQMAARFMNGGKLPDKYRRMEADWTPPEILNIAAQTDAIAKQVQDGIVPARSDVVLKRLRYTAIERAQLAQDFAADEAAQILAELATSLQAKQARADNMVASNIKSGPNVPGTGTGATASPPPAAPDVSTYHG
jgi:hypothetical protein